LSSFARAALSARLSVRTATTNAEKAMQNITEMSAWRVTVHP